MRAAAAALGDVLALLAAAAVGLVLAGGALPCLEARLRAAPPAVPPPRAAFFDLLRDARPVPLRVSEGWQKVPLVVEAEDLLRDPTLWNRMRFSDWDAVPEPLRGAGLGRMMARHRRPLSGPRAWEAMSAEDWDEVPQPVRAMAFIRMAEHRAARLRLGERAGVAPAEAADTLSAILMVESWFEHRSVHVDAQGNRDLGLAQASDYSRGSLQRLHAAGVLDFRMEERDYFDPWLSILAGATWLELMLAEAGGDLELAVRAYRLGIAAARQGGAQEYLQNVERKRVRFIRNRGAPPTWDLLSRRLRQRGRPPWERAR